MNLDYYFIQPEPGHVVEIGELHLCHYFLTGYCRGFIHAEGRLHFVGTFKRESDPGLVNSWAVPFDVPSLPLERISVGVVPEQPWMQFSSRPDSDSQTEQKL